jgi:hypothetical protein
MSEEERREIERQLSEKEDQLKKFDTTPDAINWGTFGPAREVSGSTWLAEQMTLEQEISKLKKQLEEGA